MKIKWAHLILSIICGGATLIIMSYCFYTNPPTSLFDTFSLVLGCVFGGMVAGAGFVIWFDSFLEVKLPPSKKD